MDNRQMKPENGPRDHSTLIDVSKVLGVSIATISRVLNDKPGVGPELREKVWETVKKMNYTPRAAARDLISSKRNTLGVVFQDLKAGWLLNVFRGILTKCTLSDYHVLTSVSTHPNDQIEMPARILAGQRVDGLLWCDSRIKRLDIEEMKSRLAPIVLIQNFTEDASVNTICIENVQSSYQAVSHLIKAGHRRIMVVTGRRDLPGTHQKLLGARQAMMENGLELPEEMILAGNDEGDLAVEAMADHLDAGKPLPQAIFAFSDEMALSLLFFLRSRGIRVPQDVALCGFDGLEEAAKAGLTTINTPMRELGSLAAQLLVDLIEHPEEDAEPQHVLLKGTLCVRESCGAQLVASSR